MKYKEFTTDEAREYLLKTGLPSEKITKADVDDADSLDCAVGDWIVTYCFEGECDSETAIEAAKNYHFSNDEKAVDEWLDAMMKKDDIEDGNI